MSIVLCTCHTWHGTRNKINLAFFTFTFFTPRARRGIVVPSAVRLSRSLKYVFINLSKLSSTTKVIFSHIIHCYILNPGCFYISSQYSIYRLYYVHATQDAGELLVQRWTNGRCVSPELNQRWAVYMYRGNPQLPACLPLFPAQHM